MAEMIMVKSLLPQHDDDGWPVALYEQDDQHPENADGKHEAYVAGPDPVQVARTGLVNRRISEGALEIVEDDSEDAPRARRGGRRSAQASSNPPAAGDTDDGDGGEEPKE